MRNTNEVAGARKPVSFGQKLAVGSALAVVAGSSFAQSAGVDVSAATNGLQQVADAVADIGPLMVGAVAAGIVFKWVIAFLI